MKNSQILTHTAREILVSGKGILAADESFPTIEKRFAAHHIPSTEEKRREYRELLFATPELRTFISGAILFDETMNQSVEGGSSMPEFLASIGIIPGIKVDRGTIDLPGFPGETFTQGLDGLRERLASYKELGARFTKWRAVIAIGGERPTRTSIATNARILAIFAAMSQEAGLVSIVEPEVLMSGEHTIERCEEITHTTLQSVFKALAEHRVEFGGMLLKTGMVLSGQQCHQQADTNRIAEATLRCLSSVVPAEVPGILFLSGGQGEIEATERLNAICRLRDAPWTLSISFGRALQKTALKTWKGNSENRSAAQAALYHRARCNSLAMLGAYSQEAECRQVS